MKYASLTAVLLAATMAFGFVWGMAVGTNDARALAIYDARACTYLGVISE